MSRTHKRFYDPQLIDIGEDASLGGDISGVHLSTPPRSLLARSPEQETPLQVNVSPLAKREQPEYCNCKTACAIITIIIIIAAPLITICVLAGLGWFRPCSTAKDEYWKFAVSLSTPADQGPLEQLNGSVVWPSDEDYVRLRLPWQGLYNYSSYPAMVVLPETSRDVVIALQYAVAQGLRVIPRNGGHSYAGLSVTRGMVIDLKRMNQVSVEPPLPNGDVFVTIGAGQTNMGMYVNLSSHNLSVPGGGCPSVGLSGLTLGGGFGSVSGTFGIAAGRVESIEVVAFNASTLTFQVFNASSSRNQDLFFALRGGMGGNYGVVTRWRYRAFRIHTVYEFSISGTTALDEMANATQIFFEWANTDDDNTTTVEMSLNSVRCEEPSDPSASFDEDDCKRTQQKRMLTLGGTCVCEDGPANRISDGNCTKCEERVNNLLALLRISTTWLGDGKNSAEKVPWYKMIWKIANCEAIYRDIIKHMPESESYPPTFTDKNVADCVGYWQKERIGRSKNNRKKSLFLLDDPDRAFFEHALTFMSSNANNIISPGLGINIEMYHWSGEMVKNPKPGMESAWSHRDVKWLVHVTAAFTAKTHPRVISAQQQLLNVLHDSLIQSYRAKKQTQDYQNFPDVSLAYNLWTTAYFHEDTLQRLIATNTKYSPQNLYRTEMSIPVKAV